MEWYHVLAYVFPNGIWPYLSLMYKLSLASTVVGAVVTLSYLPTRKRTIKLLGLATTAAGLLAYLFT